jgi:hypothetical protein
VERLARRNLTGASDEELSGAVRRAIRPEDDDLLERIDQQSKAKPPGGRTHPFVAWMLSLREGEALLPPRIAREMLEAWIKADDEQNAPLRHQEDEQRRLQAEYLAAGGQKGPDR